MSKKRSTLLILISFLVTSVISSSTKKVNIEMRLTYLESELTSIKSSLMETLKSVSILSKESVHKNDREGPIDLQNNSHTEGELEIKFMSLNEQINDSKSKLTEIVQNVDSLEKKFVLLTDGLSHKLHRLQDKREHGTKVTEDNFERVSKQVEKLQSSPLNISNDDNDEISQDLTIAKIRNEFSKFQLTVARDTAGIKERYIFI